jgi:hypothetical protein
MRAVVALTALFAGLVMAIAGYRLYVHLQRGREVVALLQAPVEIKINPESRVSVSLAGPWPPPVPCSTAVSIPIEVLNLGYLTAQLEAQLADAPPGASLQLQSDPLKGTPEETRILKITLTNPGPSDLTISFKAHNGAPDLGGRDRIHVLMRCR